LFLCGWLGLTLADILLDTFSPRIYIAGVYFKKPWRYSVPEKPVVSLISRDEVMKN